MSSKGIMRRAPQPLLVLALAFFSAAAFAQAPPAGDRDKNTDDLDVTMRVIVDPDAKVPDEIVRRIPLPKPAQPASGGTSTNSDTKKSEPEKPKGSDAKGREFGQQVSEDAKQRSEEARKSKKPPPAKPPGKPPGKPPSPPGRPPPPGG